MTDRHINFTKRTLESVPSSPPGKRIDYYDTKTPGLSLRVTATNTKTFTLLRRIDGRQERVTLGRFPSMTVENARARAAELNGEIARGDNPAEDRRGIRQELTLGELFDEYMTRHARLHKRTWETDQRLFNCHLGRWRNRKLSDIKRTDVQRLHANIGKTAGTKEVTGGSGRKVITRSGGHGAANHVVRLLRSMFNKAELWGWMGGNPATGVKEFPTQKRDRFIEPDEMPSLFHALMEEPNEGTRDYFFTLLFTGARRGNVMAMRWDEINLWRKEWRIPRTKNGDAQTIPLVDAMVELLTRRQAEAIGPWVFPSDSASGHIESPQKAWHRIVERAGIEDPRGTRIHDLRRSLGSWQAATGANLSVIGKTLNHRNVSTTAIYARLNLDPIRESMTKATNAMLKAGGMVEGGEVVDIKTARKRK